MRSIMLTVRRFLVTSLFLCLAMAAGCAPSTRYVWEDYDQKLYQHYKDPARYDEFIAQLKEIISEGEQVGKVPPGIYAEYGFTLYEKGKYEEAAKFFSLESKKWPESRVLMTKMVDNVNSRRNGNQVQPAEGGVK